MLTRFLSVKAFVLFLLTMLFLVGCGGDSGGSGNVAGIVFDESGNLVRDARVYYDHPDSTDDKHTFSNTTGSYTLANLPEGDRIIRAEVTVDGTRYYGQNVVRINQGDTARNTNIVVYPDNTIGAVKGVVQDRNGYLIKGAHVFARQNNGATLSSGMAISDSNGEYRINGLRDGVTYALVANALDYGTDSDTIVIERNRDLTINFLLPNPTDPDIPAPTDVFAQAFTAQSEPTVRTAAYTSAIENVKRLMDPKRASRKVSTVKRTTVNGNTIEIDLVWVRQPFKDLLGYGIYRGSSPSNLASVDFLRDPLAEIYADNDDALIEGTNYTYAMTSLNTTYGGGFGESDLSNTTTVKTLGDLEDRGVSYGPLTFRWNSAIGAEKYVVYVFDTYPSFYQTTRWTNYSSPVAGTSLAYGGPTLVSGRTYYYLLLGVADYDAGSDTWSSNTFSPIGTFVAP